ncbi:MAG: NUDIX hydrolase [Planctomycetota bacterium]
MAMPETSTNSRLVYEGRLLKVRYDDVARPDGSTGWREWVEHPSGVIIVPVRQGPDGRPEVVMIRQHRFAVGRAMEELPAGLLDVPGEASQTAAARELREETGLIAVQWTDLGRYFSQSGFCTDQAGIYLAQGLTDGPASPEDDERLEVFAQPLGQAIARCRKGPSDARTLLALLLAREALEEAGR